MPRALSGEHSRKREDHTKEGASLVGGHQKKRFSLSGFQECAHFSVSLNPPSDVVLQRMSTLNHGLLLFMAELL